LRDYKLAAKLKSPESRDLRQCRCGQLFAAGIPALTVKNELRKFRDNLHEFPDPPSFDFFWNVVCNGNALARTGSLKTLLERIFGEKRKVHVADIPKREWA